MQLALRPSLYESPLPLSTPMHKRRGSSRLSRRSSSMNKSDIKKLANSNTIDTDVSFPVMAFSALLLRLDQNLIDQRGLRSFSHQYLAKAVKQRYFKTTRFQIKCHQILAAYFSLFENDTRKAEELPYHLSKIVSLQAKTKTENDTIAELLLPLQRKTTTTNHTRRSSTNLSLNSENIEEKLNVNVEVNNLLHHNDIFYRVQNAPKSLKIVLRNLELFNILKGDRHKYDLHRYWSLLEEQNYVKSVSQEYNYSLQQFAENNSSSLEFAKKCEEVAQFLIDTDRYPGAEVYLSQALKFRIQEQGETHPDVEKTLSSQADLLYKQGKNDEALPIYRKALNIATLNEGKQSLQVCILQTSIANILKEQGKFQESLPLYESVIIIFFKFICIFIYLFINIFIYLYILNQIKKTIETQIELSGAKSAVVASSRTNLAELYLRLNNAEKALPLYKEAYKIMEVK